MNSSMSCLVLKQECWKNWPSRPEPYTKGIKVSTTQIGTELFHNVYKKYLSRT